MSLCMRAVVINSEETSQDASRYTQQRRRPPKTTRRSLIANRNPRTLHAPAPPRAEKRESVANYEQNFRARSTRQRRHPPKTAGNRIRKSGPATRRKPREGRRLRLRTLHAPAPPPAENREKAADCEQKSQDVPRSSAAAHRRPREGRRLRKEFSPAPPPTEN